MRAVAFFGREPASPPHPRPAPAQPAHPVMPVEHEPSASASFEAPEPVSAPPPISGVPVPVREGPPDEARWRTLKLTDAQLLPVLYDGGDVAVPTLHEEETPQSFFHLFAALERMAAGQSVIGVTSAVRGEGATTVALHLALSIARASYRRVCLLDLSLGEDELCRRVGATRAPGSAIDCIEADRPLAALDWPGPESMTLIPAGRQPINPARTARSPRVADLIAALRSDYDIVIVDLPSVASDNAVPLAQLLDGVVLVARAGATPRNLIKQAIDTLGRGLVTGVVLNRVTTARRRARPGRDS